MSPLGAPILLSVTSARMSLNVQRAMVFEASTGVAIEKQAIYDTEI